MARSRNKLSFRLANAKRNSPLTTESKQGSPLYAEQEDDITPIATTISRSKPWNNLTTNKYRHSDPGCLQTPVKAQSSASDRLGGIEKAEEKPPLISSSVVTLFKRLGTKDPKNNQDAQRYFLGGGLQRRIYEQRRGWLLSGLLKIHIENQRIER